MMKINDIRPEWRNFMLFFLRWIIQPINSGAIPRPTISIENQEVRGRLLELAPDIGPQLEHCSVSAVALMDAIYAQKMRQSPLQKTIDLYQGLNSITAASQRQTFTHKDVLELVNMSEFLLGGVSFHSDWLSIFSSLADDRSLSNVPDSQPDIHFFQWYFGLLIITLYRWGIPFPLLLYVAREGSEPIATNALLRTITVEKTAVGLPWVLQRVQEAEAKNDRTFMRRFGQAFAMSSVPKELKGRVLDLFLCVFNPWLNELPLAEQAALLRQGGLEVSEKGLRNRRSRLGLPAAGQKSNAEIPPQILQLIEQTQSIWKKPIQES